MHIYIGSWEAVSSTEQAEGESLADQAMRNRAFIDDFSRYYPGYAGSLSHSFTVAESRSITLLTDACAAIPEYQRLIDLIKQPKHIRKLDALIFQSLDRLARSPALIATLNELMLTHGVVPIPRNNLPRTLDCDAILNDFGAGITTAVDAQRAGSEVRELVRRNRIGMPKRIREKKLFPSKPNYGYKIVDGKIVDDVGEQAILRRALLELYADGGLSGEATATELNARGIPSPGGSRWYGDTLRKLIIRLPIYEGKLLLNQTSKSGRPLIETDGVHNPVFTKAEADRIRAAKDLHRHERRLSVHSPFLGIVFCGPCNHQMHVYMSPKRTPNGWRDRWRMRCRKCHRTISRRKILSAIGNAVATLQKKSLDELVPPADSVETKQRRDQIAQALADLTAERKRLVHGYVTLAAIPEDDFEKRSKALAARETLLLGELDKLGNAETEADRRRSSIERLARIRDESDDRLLQLKNDEDHTAVRSWLHQWLRLVVDREDGENRVAEIVIF